MPDFAAHEQGKTNVQEDTNRTEVSTARLEKLLRRLRADDPVIRIRAASLISEVGPQARAALPTLLEFLSDASPQRRKLAAWTLGNLGKQAVEAIPALGRALQDSDEGVSSMSQQALEKILRPPTEARAG
jgi:HEAT repeat protein